MKSYFVKITLFSIPMVLFLVVLELLLRNIPNDYAIKAKTIMANRNNIELLILGSSHAVAGVNPACFDFNSYNLANISQSLNYDEKLLKKYGQKLSNLKVIILPVSYGSLFSRIEKGRENWRIKNYTIYFGIIASWKISNFAELLNGKVRMNIARILVYYIHGIKGINITSLGFGTNFSSSVKNDLYESGLVASKRHTKSFKYFDYNSAILERIVEYCEKNDILLVLFTPPAYRTYRDNINDEQYKAMLNRTKRITDASDSVYYFNFFADSDFTGGRFL